MAQQRISKAELTAVQLKNLLDYDPQTGQFRWKDRPYLRRVKPGELAGKIDKGYVRIRILGRDFRAHILVWFLETDTWPNEPIDHFDGNKQNNRPGNLRLGGNGINSQNRRLPSKNNTTGFLGVCTRARELGFYASIGINDRIQRLGKFDTPEAAHEAYLIAKRQLHAGCTI